MRKKNNFYAQGGKIVFLSLFLALIVSGCSLAIPQNKSAKSILGVEEAKAKAEKFINDNLLPSNIKAVVKDIKDDGDLYNLSLDVAGKSYTSYMTKDGKKFFQTGVDIDQVAQQGNNQNTNQAANQQNNNQTANFNKTDKPKVELFVMSYCPYGTQIEKGLLPVISALGDKIDFTLKFVSYSMHGKKEIDENLAQVCIQKQGKEKLTGYLGCFLKSGDSSSCLNQAGVNSGQLQSCIKATDQQYKITDNYNNQSAWSGQYPPFNVNKNDDDKYSVQGSPTLIINGQEASSARDSNSLLKTVCSAFNNQPSGCSKQLTSAAPSPGFGDGAGGGSSSGGCATN